MRAPSALTGGIQDYNDLVRFLRADGAAIAS